MAISQEIMDHVQKEIKEQRGTLEEMIGHAASIMNNMDITHKAIIGECSDARARMEERINKVNGAKQEINGLKADIVSKITEVEGKLNQLNDQSTAITESLQSMGMQPQGMKVDFDLPMEKRRTFATDTNTEIQRAKADSEQSMARLYGEIKDWATGFQARIDSGGFGGKGRSGHIGTSSGKGKSTLDKKEVNVWKLPESLTKADFRTWLDAVDNQLEAIHGFSKPEIVLAHVRRMETWCTRPAYDHIFKSINKSGEKVDYGEWDFEETSTLI